MKNYTITVNGNVYDSRGRFRGIAHRFVCLEIYGL